MIFEYQNPFELKTIKLTDFLKNNNLISKEESGVYFLFLENKIIYVGKTAKLQERLRGHSNGTMFVQYFLEKICFAYLVFKESYERTFWEAFYLFLYNPKYCRSNYQKYKKDYRVMSGLDFNEGDTHTKDGKLILY